MRHAGAASGGRERFSYVTGFGYESFTIYCDGSLPRLVPRDTAISTKFICNIPFSRPDAIGEYWPGYLHEPGAL